jgi:hypothetical protein
MGRMSDPKTPLVTPRSPSNARAQSGEDPGESANADRIASLSRLVEIEENARRVHERAGSEAAAQHAARRDRLAAKVAALGGSAPQGKEIRSLLSSDDPSAIGDEVARAYRDAGEDPE